MQQMFKIARAIHNVPLLELHNFCMVKGYELDLANEEIVMFEVSRQ